MRIRSIKPEFWTDEELSALPAETVLLAVALNNYADDEGFFNANPRLIEATLMPLRELSVKVPGSLTDLSRIGWIEVRESPDGKRVGRLVHFRRDQVISHPRKSELRTAWEASGKINGNHMEDSGSIPAGMEGNGREGKGKERNGTAPERRGREASRKPGSVHPEEQLEPVRTRMIAIGCLLRRMPSTRWSRDEFDAFTASGIESLAESDFAEQLAPLQRYYGANIPREKDFRRRDVLRLLKNWAGELDKARAFARDNDDGVKRT